MFGIEVQRADSSRHRIPGPYLGWRNRAARTRWDWGFAAEGKHHTAQIAPAILVGGQSQVAVEVGIQVVHLKGTDGKASAHSNIKSKAGCCRECVVGRGFTDSREIQGIDGIFVDVAVRTADQSFCEWTEPTFGKY